MTKRVFYSFHYKPDNWRVAQVRNIGAIEDNKPASDNDWETVTKNGDDAITKWISNQMQGRSCTVVLVGEKTANRKWINHEISQSWTKGIGVVGVYIHGLKNTDGYIANRGNNPFDYLIFKKSGAKMSSVVKCFNPQGTNSKERYDWICKNIESIIEDAIKIRNNNQA